MEIYQEKNVIQRDTEDNLIEFLKYGLIMKSINVVEYVVHSNYQNFYYTNKLGENLMHLAVKRNFTELINWLLCRDLNINSKDHSSRTPLHIAISLENYDLVKYLLNAGADTSLKDCYGKSSFHIAVDLGNVNLVGLLLEYGADVLDSTVITKQTAFHIALKNQDREVFKLLLNSYCGDIDVLDEWEETPLHLVSRQKNNQDLANLLLQRGADLEAVNTHEETPLHLAIHSRNYETVKLFIESGANTSAKNKFNESPLNLAIRSKDVALVLLFLTNNADIDEIANNDNSLMHIAVDYYNRDVVMLLIQYGVTIEGRNMYDVTPFSLAIKNKDLHAAKLLLENGADINTVSISKFGYHSGQMFTALQLSISQKDVDSVRFLLENGADFSKNYEIFLAVKGGSAEIVRELLRYGSNVNAVNSSGRSVFFTAMETCNIELVEEVLDGGALQNINETNVEGDTALHLAAKSGNGKFVEYLLDSGIDINICNLINKTALECISEHMNISNSLLQHMALMKVNKFFISQAIEHLIDRTPNYKTYFFNCLKELEGVKQVKYFNVPVVNVLMKNKHAVRKLLRYKEEYNRIYSRMSNSDEFPIYHKRFLRKVNEAAERDNLVLEAKRFLYTSPYFGPIFDVLDIILDNLSVGQLKQLFCGSSSYSEN